MADDVAPVPVDDPALVIALANLAPKLAAYFTIKAAEGVPGAAQLAHSWTETAWRFGQRPPEPTGRNRQPARR